MNFITVTGNADLDQINVNKTDCSNNAAAISAITTGAPALLNTLNELASALGDDANFSTTVTTALSNRVQMTGDETIAGVKTFSSPISGNITGNSGTTTKFASQRKINDKIYDGTSDITVDFSDLNDVTAGANALGSGEIITTTERTNFTDVSNNAVRLSGTQTVTGATTFNNLIVNTFSATTFDGDLSGNIVGDTTITGFMDISGNVDISGVLDVSGNIKTGGAFVGDLTGNADTVTNGVYNTGVQTLAGTYTFNNSIVGDLTGDVTGNLTGNADTVTNGVYNTGVQTLGGTYTFTNNVICSGNVTGNVTGNLDGNITGNAVSVTNGVYNTGVQTLGGNYTFTNLISGNIDGDCDGTANKIKNDTVDNNSTSGTVGELGEIRFNSSYMYICTLAGRGNWKRVSLSTF